MGEGRVAIALIASLSLTACSLSLSSQPAAPRWTTGFWVWDGNVGDAGLPEDPLDVVFFSAGQIRKETFGLVAGKAWFVSHYFPEKLPAAREYWAVFRYEGRGVPDLQAVPFLLDEIARLRVAARDRLVPLAGVQLDIDSPTASLGQYAAFLRKIRKQLPHGFEISITALLDWFRSGTEIAAVIREVDEFVPQFYDTGDEQSRHGGTIAARIDPARWGPVFNRYRKRFRIGISTFGRAQQVAGSAARGPYAAGYFLDDVLPVDLAANSAFPLQAARNPANELVLTYRAARRTKVGYRNLDPGDGFRFVISTPESVAEATESARKMRGYSAGVVYFRWPSGEEVLAMQPSEVLAAVGEIPARQMPPHRIQTVAGDCAAAECADVYLQSFTPLSPQPLHCLIHSSTELEYFLPEKRLPVRMAGPSTIEVSLPPYCARGRLYLGRAVSARRVEFTVEVSP